MTDTEVIARLAKQLVQADVAYSKLEEGMRIMKKELDQRGELLDRTAEAAGREGWGNLSEFVAALKGDADDTHGACGLPADLVRDILSWEDKDGWPSASGICHRLQDHLREQGEADNG